MLANIALANELDTYEIIERNAMSGIWSMLNGNTMKFGFPISTINYNIFDDENILWLKRIDNYRPGTFQNANDNDEDEQNDGKNDDDDDDGSAAMVNTIRNQLKNIKWIQK